MGLHRSGCGGIGQPERIGDGNAIEPGDRHRRPHHAGNGRPEEPHRAAGAQTQAGRDVDPD